MRTMLTWKVPVEKGNKMIEDGSMQTVIEDVMALTNPEAAYFVPVGGRRGGILFFDMKEPADIARIAEKLFLGAHAEVEIVPVMNADDLQAALSSL